MKKRRDNISSILVIRLSSIGDIIITTPVLSALRQKFPDAAIDFVVKKEFRELVADHPAVNHVWTFDKDSGFNGLKSLRKELDKQSYDLIVDLHRNLRSTYLRVCTKAFCKRGYRKRTLARLMLKKFRVNLLKNAPAVCDRYFTALEDFGVEREDRKPEFFISPETCKRVSELLKEKGLDPDGGHVCLAPGARYPTKQWFAEGYIEAGASLSKNGKAVVLVGDGPDEKVCSFIEEKLKEKGAKCLDLAGRLGIAESAAVVKKASVVISNDSGLMHIADALDRPLVAAFGPTTRELGFYPQGDKARVVEVQGLACRPCTLHGDRECPEGHHNCMRMIGPDQVVGEAEKMMEKEKELLTST